jgi:hypothetical protein
MLKLAFSVNKNVNEKENQSKPVLFCAMLQLGDRYNFKEQGFSH